MTKTRMLYHEAKRLYDTNPAITATELARALDIPRSTAWVVLRRIREGKHPVRWVVIPAQGRKTLIRRDVVQQILEQYPYASLRDIRDMYVCRTGIPITAAGLWHISRRVSEDED